MRHFFFFRIVSCDQLKGEAVFLDAPLARGGGLKVKEGRVEGWKGDEMEGGWKEPREWRWRKKMKGRWCEVEGIRCRVEG